MTPELRARAVGLEAEPIEYQARYWKTRALTAEAQLKQERRRKEPETLQQVEKALRDARETIRSINDDRQVWKKISHGAYLRIDQLEQEGAAAVLKRERDHWREQWRACTRRLGNCIEHLGLDYVGLEPNKDS